MAINLFGGPVKGFADKLIKAMNDYSSKKSNEASEMDTVADPSKSFDKLKNLIISQVFKDFSEVLRGVVGD